MLEFLFASLFAVNEPFLQKPIPVRRPSVTVKRDIGENKTKTDTNDLCPNVPGKNRGCPSMDLYNGNNEGFWTLSVLNENFETKEKTEIQIGDAVFVGFEDQKTGEIFSASEAAIIRK